MKKSIFYLVLFLFISISSYCQDISSINFEFHCSACKRNSDITIRIPDGTYTAVKDSVLIRIDSIPVYVKSESMKIDKILFISKLHREKIVKKVCKISSIELIKNFSWGTDGSHTRLEIGSAPNFISYYIWGVSINDKKENKDFIEAILMIFEAAKMDPKLFYR